MNRIKRLKLWLARFPWMGSGLWTLNETVANPAGFGPASQDVHVVTAPRALWRVKRHLEQMGFRVEPSASISFYLYITRDWSGLREREPAAWVAMRRGGGGHFEVPKLRRSEALDYVCRQGSHTIWHVDDRNLLIFYSDRNPT
jgi:hypothetical protein